MELVESWATMWDLSNMFEGVEEQPSRAISVEGIQRLFGATPVEQIQRLVPIAFDSRVNLALLVLAKKPY